MKKSSLIGHVCELLELLPAGIQAIKQPADAIVKEFFRQRHYLGSKDRRFISETTFAVLRNFMLARFYATDALRHAGVSSVPTIAVYVCFALKVQNEDAAALLTDVGGIWRNSLPGVSCEDFIRAVAQAHPPQMENPVQRRSIMHSFPETIVREWVERFGEEETERLCAASNRPAPTVIRVNTLKASVGECRARLSAEGIESEPAALSPSGLVLTKRINAQALQSFKDGWFEMQDEGSQLIALLLGPEPGDVVIDACAGGGGKTLHIAALMKNEGEIHACDVDERRLANIQPRLRRAGVSIARVHRADSQPGMRLAARADAVLVDAPCSGVGTFRRNPGEKLSFDDTFVERISGIQKRVLETYASCVKPGGRLVYSTCTLLRKENEEVVESFLASHPGFMLISAPEVLRKQSVTLEASSVFLTLFPHRTNTDGFFAAVVERIGGPT